MSPEQARGEITSLDRRTDLFSLGVVLYELLTGRRPFPSEQPHELREQILGADPTPPRRANPAIPPALETACLTALAKEPGERFQTAAAMAEALRAVDKPRLGRRTQVTLGIVMAGMAVLAGIAGGTVVLWTGRRPEAGPARPTSEIRDVAIRVPTSTVETESHLWATPTALAPGSPEWRENEAWKKRQEQELLASLKKTVELINQPPQLPPRRPFGLNSPDDPTPIAWFAFDDPQDRLRNLGRFGPSTELKARGQLKFTSPGDPDAPPEAFGNGVRLANGAAQEGLIGDKSWLEGEAWSISLWFWQRESRDDDFLVHLGGQDGSGGGGPEFTAAIVPPGNLEVASFSDSSPTGQKTLVGRFPVATRRWHHFVITFQAKDPTVTGQGTVTAYLDNRQIGKQDEVSLTSAMRLSEGALIFGAAYQQHQSDAWHQALDGLIADIQVFDTRLSEEQVSRMWQEIAP